MLGHCCNAGRRQERAIAGCAAVLAWSRRTFKSCLTAAASASALTACICCVACARDASRAASCCCRTSDFTNSPVACFLACAQRHAGQFFAGQQIALADPLNDGSARCKWNLQNPVREQQAKYCSNQDRRSHAMARPVLGRVAGPQAPHGALTLLSVCILAF